MSSVLPGSVRAALPIAADHPSFAGHFPGQPILPGVVLLAELLEAMRRHAATAAWLGAAPQLTQAKFITAVRPGEALEAEWTLPGSAAGRARFEIHRLAADGSRISLAASGQIQAGEAP
jgi:3-hydroxymyristoyl/3-hydroxydecanoyl-(acyl carrier protein) dehydratase